MPKIFRELAVGVAGGLIVLLIIAIWGWISAGGLVRVLGGSAWHEMIELSERVQQAERSLSVLQEMSSNQLVAGMILSYVGDPTAVPTGWVVCGQDGTPDLNGRFLMGTTDWREAGTELGSEDHNHHLDITSGGERDGRFQAGPTGTDRDYADNIRDGQGVTGQRNWHHAHQVQGNLKGGHLPPSMKVIFICRNT